MKRILKTSVLLTALFCLFAGSASAFTFDGEFARLTVNEFGSVTSICEKPSGRELAGPPSPVMTAVLNNMKRGNVRSFAKVPGAADLYELRFTGIDGSVTLAVESFRGGWTFRVEKTAIEQLHAIIFFSIKPPCRKYVGARINGVSDDESGVVLRSYRTDGSHAYPAGALQVTYLSSRPFVGAAVGLAAGARASIPEMMRGMTVAAGIPHPTSGGGWSLDSEDNQMSYLIADSASVATMDDLLAIAERTGVGRFHFRSFWDQYGWYAVNTNLYPRELADLRDCSLKAKAAGLKTSIHNLSGCVGRSAPWLKTEMADGLRICHTYTLAEPIPAAGDVAEIRVNEKPADDHGYDFATWSRGNTIRIDGEMFQYSEISREKPYAFRKIRRARFGTTAKAHAAGAKADYLWCFFGSFLAKPGTPISEAVADRYARIYAGGDFDGIYNDGLDGYGRWPQDCAVFARMFYGRCAQTGKAPHFEDSLWTTHGWWFHSMVGSWDYARWSAKTFIDRHVEANLMSARLTNFQQMTLGWWPVVVGSPSTFGYSRDDVEYFGAKISGYGCGFSLIPNYYRGHVIAYGALAQLTILGWYERLRTSGALRPELLPIFREKGRDFRLAQDADGVWKVRPIEVTKHHMVSPTDRRWQVTAKAAAPAALRIRPLDGGTPWDGKNTLTVLSASMAGELAVRSEKGVTGQVGTGTSDHGRTLRFTVRNEGAAPNGSWAVAERTIPRPFLNLYKGDAKKAALAGQDAPNKDYAYAVAQGTPLALGVWVRGDGSGADVNFQLHSPADVNDARTEHHVKLDFTGWRYFTFSIWREHSPEITEQYRWPYLNGASYNIYERSLACGSVQHVGVWMNGIGKGKAASVEISDLRVMAEKPQALKAGSSVTIGGTRHTLPFDLGSGEFAELEDGFWTRYSAGWEPQCRKPAEAAPQLAAGANDVVFDCPDASVRAQVTVTAFGEKEPALVKEWTSKAQKIMAYEGDYPRFFAPHRNCGELPPTVIRAGERARISYELFGPIPDPVLTVGGETIRIGRDVKLNEVVRGEFKGTFEGTVPVRMTTGNPGKTAAYLALAKRYVKGEAAGGKVAPARHEPLRIVGRSFWHGFGSYSSTTDWKTGNPEIDTHRAFTDAMTVYQARRAMPPPKVGSAVWPNFADNFVEKDPDRWILEKCPDPTRPFSVEWCGERNCQTWGCPVKTDVAAYRAWSAKRPNMITDGSILEWYNDLYLARQRIRDTDKFITPKTPEGTNRYLAVKAFLGEEPKNRYEQLALMKRYFAMRRERNFGGRMSVMDAHLNTFHLAGDLGAVYLRLETTGTGQYRHQPSAMFARGAARQFGVPWEWYIANYMNGPSKKYPGEFLGNAVCRYRHRAKDTGKPLYTEKVNGRRIYNWGPDFGISRSDFKRTHYLAYLSGANVVWLETWPYILKEWDDSIGKQRLSPRGRIYAEFIDFTYAHPERGTHYSPVAVCVPLAQGYPTWGGYPYDNQKFGYTDGDKAVDAVFYTLVPGCDFSAELARGAERLLRNSPYADMYDVIAPDVESQTPEQLLAVMKSYRALVVAGDYPDKGWEKTLARYEAEGGRVIRVDKAMLSDEVKSGKKRSVASGETRYPKLEAAFQKLQKDYFPFEVTGSCAYGLTVANDHAWLYVFNNDGVIKFADAMEELDATKASDVTVKLGSGGSVTELLSGKAVAVQDGAFGWHLGPGEFAIFEIRK